MKKSIGVVAFAFSSALACGPESLVRNNNPDGGIDQMQGGATSGDGGTTGRPDGGRRDGGSSQGGNRVDGGTQGGFSGSYALLIDIPQQWTLPVLGTRPATIRMLVSADVSGDVPSVAFDGQLCDIDILYEGNLTIAVPDAAITAISNVRGAANIGAGSGGAVDLNAGPFVVLGGWNGGETEALPTTNTDARLTDPDNDGNPGITFNLVPPGITTGNIYVAMRASIGFQAAAMNLDSFDADSDSDVAVAIVEATTGLAPRGLVQATPGDPSRKRFSFVRVDDGSCDAIRAAKDTLFP